MTLDLCCDPGSLLLDFDWADLERRLGEVEEQLEGRDSAALGSALQSIIEWIIEGADFTKLDADAHVGRCAIALFWTLNPDYFEGYPSPPWPTASVSVFTRPSSALRPPRPGGSSGSRTVARAHRAC